MTVYIQVHASTVAIWVCMELRMEMDVPISSRGAATCLASVPEVSGGEPRSSQLGTAAKGSEQQSGAEQAHDHCTQFCVVASEGETDTGQLHGSFTAANPGALTLDTLDRGLP